MAAENSFGGRYQVTATLAEGPHATVYLARDETSGQTVAVKALRPGAATPNQALDWLAAAKQAETGRGAHVLPVLSSHGDAGRTWLAMPYVAGGNLRALLDRRGALPPAEALAIGEQVLAGLREAREQGQGHGNLKPENVLLDGEAVKVADFGQRLPMPALAYTPRALAYVAPEVRLGAASGEQADVYSWGVVLYELLVGRLPTSTASRPRDLDPRLPPAIDLLVARALSPTAAERWSSLAELAAALAAFQAQVPARPAFSAPSSPPIVAAPVPRLSETAPEERIMPPWPMLLVGLMTMALMTSLIVFAASWVPQALSSALVFPTAEPTRGGEIPMRVIQPTATPTVTSTPTLTPTPLPNTTYTPTPSPTRTPRPSATPTPGPGRTPPAPGG